MSAQVVKRSINLKSVALPAEHGGWGFLLEAMVLGLIVAPSAMGLLFGVAMLAAFLIHQPLKITVKDWLKQRRTERTQLAEKFVLGYGLTALLLLIAVWQASGTGFFIPLLIALPLMAVQFFYDVQNDSRELVPELCGGVALGAIAASVAILGDWEHNPALILWLLLAARTIPAILYVRARLRLERGKPADLVSAWITHGIALALVTGFWIADQTHLLSVLIMLVLLLRAGWGLSAYRTPAKRPAIIGFQEIFYGFLTAVLIGIGY